VLDFVPNTVGLKLAGSPGYMTLKQLSTVFMLNHKKTVDSTSRTL
jgi:hypothetical protein